MIKFKKEELDFNRKFVPTHEIINEGYHHIETRLGLKKINSEYVNIILYYRCFEIQNNIIKNLNIFMFGKEKIIEFIRIMCENEQVRLPKFIGESVKFINIFIEELKCLKYYDHKLLRIPTNYINVENIKRLQT
jgi:hypothetical protein